MKKHILLIVLLLNIGTSLIQCSPMEKKYDYSTEVTSADGYQCYVSWNDCYIGESPLSFSTDHSWGYGNGMTRGPERKTLPDTMQVIYYSLTENQFYALKTSLPQEKIRTLLDGSYKYEVNDKPSTYTTFSVGIAPCGFVSLWLGGGAGQVLIGTYRANKAKINYKWAFPTRTWNQEEAFEEYTKSLYSFIKEEMAEDRISSTYWESLNTLYNWKLLFSDSDFSLYDYHIYTINQENRFYMTDPNWPVTEGEKYIPVELILYLKHRMDPVKYKVSIYLREPNIKYKRDEDKEVTVQNYMNRSRALLKFFNEFYRKIGAANAYIYLDFDFSMEKMKLKLKSGDYEEEFPEYTFKIYDSERYNYR